MRAQRIHADFAAVRRCALPPVTEQWRCPAVCPLSSAMQQPLTTLDAWRSCDQYRLDLCRSVFERPARRCCPASSRMPGARLQHGCDMSPSSSVGYNMLGSQATECVCEMEVVQMWRR